MTKYTKTFQAEVKHIATSGKLAVFDGRKDGGSDIYVNLAQLADKVGGLPETAKVTITVEAAGEMVDDCMAVVPRTEQNRFDGNKAMFEDIYGMTVPEHLEMLLNGEEVEEKAKPKKKAKTTTKTKAKSKAPAKRTTKTKAKTTATRKAAKSTTTTKAKAKPGTAPGSEATSLVDRVNGLENMMGQILEAVSK